MIYYDMIHSPLVYLIMLAGTYSTISRFLGWDDDGTGNNKNYYKIPRIDQLKITVAYVSLIATLIFAMSENNKYRIDPKRLQAKLQQKKSIYDDNIYDPFDYVNKVHDGLFEENDDISS